MEVAKRTRATVSGFARRRPFRIESCTLSAGVPRNRCAGFMQRPLSQRWQTSRPSGIGPMNNSYANRPAWVCDPSLRETIRCPLRGSTYPDKIQHGLSVLALATSRCTSVAFLWRPPLNPARGLRFRRLKEEPLSVSLSVSGSPCGELQSSSGCWFLTGSPAIASPSGTIRAARGPPSTTGGRARGAAFVCRSPRARQAPDRRPSVGRTRGGWCRCAGGTS